MNSSLRKRICKIIIYFILWETPFIPNNRLNEKKFFPITQQSVKYGEKNHENGVWWLYRVGWKLKMDITVTLGQQSRTTLVILDSKIFLRKNGGASECGASFRASSLSLSPSVALTTSGSSYVRKKRVAWVSLNPALLSFRAAYFHPRSFRND